MCFSLPAGSPCCSTLGLVECRKKSGQAGTRRGKESGPIGCASCVPCRRARLARGVSLCVLRCRGYTRGSDAVAGWLGVVGTGQDGPLSCGKSRLAVLLRPCLRRASWGICRVASETGACPGGERFAQSAAIDGRGHVCLRDEEAESSRRCRRAGKVGRSCSGAVPIPIPVPVPATGDTMRLRCDARPPCAHGYQNVPGRLVPVTARSRTQQTGRSCRSPGLASVLRELRVGGV